MVEGSPSGGQEQVKLKPFRITLTHEDEICHMYMERKVKWKLSKTYMAENLHKARALAENDKVVGICGHIYSFNPRGKR